MPAKSPAAEAFRRNVRQLMDEREMTITQVAELAKVSRPGVSRILSGDEGVTLARAERIAKVFGVPLPELIVQNGVPKKVRQTA